MYDTIVDLFNSRIQHGVHNNRIYLMHLANEDMPKIIDELDSMAIRHKYGKIFVKVPNMFANVFLKNGYIPEAAVPRFFNGKEGCVFMGKYMREDRYIQKDAELNKRVLDTALLKAPPNLSEACFEEIELPKEFTFRIAATSDAFKMAELYSKVFPSYPFPVFDSEYIEATMDDNVIYFGIWQGNYLVALSSCEMYRDYDSVEMTDFAVLPEYRGCKFSYFLLSQMEKYMKNKKFKTAYTIARAVSYGMNSAFSRCGYTFSGVLINNTQIGGEIEDMNVWYKSLI